MDWMDLGNSVFESFGFIAVWGNVAALRKSKCVRGVSLLAFAFFASWGYWNLFYYPHLDQWLSFVAGIGIVVANTTWIVLAWRYRAN